MAPVGMPGVTVVSNGIYAPTGRVRVRAEYMSETYEALGRVIAILSRAGRENDAVESVAWDQFKDSAQKLTGDMRSVRKHYGHAVTEFGRFVSESDRLHADVEGLVASHNQLLEQLYPLRQRLAEAEAAAAPSPSEVLSSIVAAGESGAAELQQRIQDSTREAAALLDQIVQLQSKANEAWEAIAAAEVRQGQLAREAADALSGARDVSGLNDGFLGNLSAFLSGLLDIVISVLKVVVMILLIVLTLVTLVLTPFIGPAPAAGLLLLTIFVAGALFVAQVVKAALDCVDFGAFMAALGAAALHFGAVVLGAFLGGIGGAFVKGLLGSLGPLIAGAVAAAVKTAIQQGITRLVDATLVDGLLELGGPEARQIYDELVGGPAGQILEKQFGGIGSGLADSTGAAGLATDAGAAVARGTGLETALDAVVDATSGVVGTADDLARQFGGALDSIFGEGTADHLRDAGVGLAGDVLQGENVGESLLDRAAEFGMDWLEDRVDSFLSKAEDYAVGRFTELSDGTAADDVRGLSHDLGADLDPVDQAFQDAGLGGFEKMLDKAGLGDITDFGRALAEGKDPISLGLDILSPGEAAQAMNDWIVDTDGIGEVMAATSELPATFSWVGSSDD